VHESMSQHFSDLHAQRYAWMMTTHTQMDGDAQVVFVRVGVIPVDRDTHILGLMVD